MAVWPLNWLLTSSSDTSPNSTSPRSSSALSERERKKNLVSVNEGGGGATDTKTLEQVTTLLEPFKATGKLPEKARTDPSVLIKDIGEQGLSIARLFEYVPFFVSNGEPLVSLSILPPESNLVVLARSSSPKDRDLTLSCSLPLS